MVAPHTVNHLAHSAHTGHSAGHAAHVPHVPHVPHAEHAHRSTTLGTPAGMALTGYAQSNGAATANEDTFNQKQAQQAQSIGRWGTVATLTGIPFMLDAASGLGGFFSRKGGEWLKKGGESLNKDQSSLWMRSSDFFMRTSNRVGAAHSFFNGDVKAIVKGSEPEIKTGGLFNTKIGDARYAVRDGILGRAMRAERLGDMDRAGDLRIKAENVQVKMDGIFNRAASFMEPLTNRVSNGFAAMQNKGGIAESIANGLQKAGKFAGKGTLMMGLLAVSGTIASVIAIKKNNSKLDGQDHAVETIEAAVGSDNILAEAARKELKASRKAAPLSVAATITSEVAGTAGMAPAVLHSPAGMALIPVQMGLGKVAEAIAPESPMLNAINALRASEASGAPLNPEQAAAHWRHVVAALPSVKTHGGYYNRLAAPVAEALVEKGLSVDATLKLISDNAAFTSLASEVYAKQNAPEAANEANFHAAANEPTFLAAEGPKKHVSAIENHGRIAQMQRAIA